MPRHVAIAVGVLCFLSAVAQAQVVAEKLEPYPLPAKALESLTKLAGESDVLVLGETHGTQETPVVAAALLTPLAKLGYGALALEIPADEQQRLVDWAAGKTETVPRFFAKLFADGRGNLQTLALIRTALSPPHGWRLICFDVPWQASADELRETDRAESEPESGVQPEDGAKMFVRRDAAMAAKLAKERARIGGDIKVLAICGKFHARTSNGRKAGGPEQKLRDDAMKKFWPSFAAALASEHRAWRVRSVNVVPHSGSFFAMLSSGDGPPQVGVHPIRSTRHFDEAEVRALGAGDFDWELNLPRATAATFLVPPTTEILSD